MRAVGCLNTVSSAKLTVTPVVTETINVQKVHSNVERLNLVWCHVAVTVLVPGTRFSTVPPQRMWSSIVLHWIPALGMSLFTAGPVDVPFLAELHRAVAISTFIDHHLL